jgi:hypothetical protein
MTRQSMMTTRKSCSQEGCTHGVIKEGGECVSSHMAQRWRDALRGMYQLCQKGRSLRYTWHANKVTRLCSFEECTSQPRQEGRSMVDAWRKWGRVAAKKGGVVCVTHGARKKQ